MSTCGFNPRAVIASEYPATLCWYENTLVLAPMHKIETYPCQSRCSVAWLADSRFCNRIESTSEEKKLSKATTGVWHELDRAWYRALRSEWCPLRDSCAESANTAAGERAYRCGSAMRRGSHAAVRVSRRTVALGWSTPWIPLGTRRRQFGCGLPEETWRSGSVGSPSCWLPSKFAQRTPAAQARPAETSKRLKHLRLQRQQHQSQLV